MNLNDAASRLPASTLSHHQSEPFKEPAADGYPIGGFTWRHIRTEPTRPVVIINAATSVRCRHYSRFADYLFAHGFDVITYDYRGIGESRTGSLKGFKASWSDWGVLDFEAMLQRALREFPGQPIDVVAHSFGGCAAGLAASGAAIRRVVTVGAQFAYWRDYEAGTRWRMFGKWHVVMPLMTALCGYFPGKRMGWLEDTPAGVVKDWATATPKYETRPSGKALGELPFGRVKAQVLAISICDDPFGTVAAIERLLGYFNASERTHLRIAPEDIGEKHVGHFAFFRSEYQDRLWPIALAWLQRGALAHDTPGRRVADHA
ncbi:alpha/beta fold hydrolase [Pseudomonas tolaasii]|uniref:Alpha/beta fold hydrolase n=2 Tax=Pseudomonas tolaasii TaxID=29442 RepID=A0A7Y8DSL4_PSETO|nr:alpha/beta fold hydrolase [Pseudomonas tolaasii]ARB29654.1 alpha/beta hydrolase [Pseudomonas tolaasii]KAB0466189.1 alpha/beta fold hydrolase [Pseudomonas tolaasii]MBY8941259.1 alpha/beta fold hydrolase [Pseudomonas tolaasii]NWC19765.1 alpha/beta fold hydrolase [Pseudomonas tolaasii]NWC40868.1 alpha/beta fold hydrolase [Pseudomonas tolaasii]